MKRIVLISFLFLSLVLCSVPWVWAGGLDDFKAGTDAQGRGDYDEAIRLYTKAIASGDLSQEKLSEVYNRRGNAWYSKFNGERALADYNKAIKVNPKNSFAYSNRGNLWFWRRDYNPAMADFNKAIELNPKDDFTYYHRGDLWFMKGDYDRAIADYNKEIELNPKDADVYVSRAVAWENKRDYDRAIADYSKAIEVAPQFAYAYFRRGRAWKNKGDYDRAVADYNKGIEVDPRDYNAFNSLAWLLATCPESRYRNGVRAIQLATRAVELLDAANNIGTLAAAYAEAGRFQEAIKTQERAIAKLKKEKGNKKDMAEYEKHLASYKAGKPWREK